MKTKGLLKKRKSQKAPNQEIVEDKDQVAVVEDESIKQNKEATDNKEKGSEEELKDKEETVTNPDFFSIFLSGLPYTCQEEQIREFLRECGEIKSILLPKYQDTGRCRGYAHVEFKKKKGLLKVREDYKKKGLALNGQKIGDRYIDISQSKGKAAVKENRAAYPPSECTTIFVKNLPYEGVTEDNVGDKFRHCGPIRSVRFSYNWQTKKFKGFCYIEFEKPESVKKALQMNGKQINGRNIIVDFDVGEARKGYKLNFKEEGNIKYSKIQQEIKHQKEKASKATFRKKGPKLAL